MNILLIVKVKILVGLLNYATIVSRMVDKF